LNYLAIFSSTTSKQGTQAASLSLFHYLSGPISGQQVWTLAQVGHNPCPSVPTAFQNHGSHFLTAILQRPCPNVRNLSTCYFLACKRDLALVIKQGILKCEAYSGYLDRPQVNTVVTGGGMQ
jgi:hypothetical protein